MCVSVSAPVNGELDHPTKKIIVISARVHPGETNASWMMRGFLFFITSQQPEAVALRKNYVFKLIPMINPDGVAVGNYRCSLAGLDLNRQWINPKKSVTPCVYAVKRLLVQYRQRILMYCDLHGHSRKRGAFFYGCESPDYRERHLPFVFDQMTDLFDADKCSYGISKSKAGTARVVSFSEIGLTFAYTLEASFAGPSGRNIHYSTSTLEQIGTALGKAIYAWQQVTSGFVRSVSVLARFSFGNHTPFALSTVSVLSVLSVSRSIDRA